MTKNKVGRPTRFKQKQKIVKLFERNPRRKGSQAFDVYSGIKNNMSIKSFVSKGGDLRHIREGVDRGWLEVID